jgi:hypothetical protein
MVNPEQSNQSPNLPCPKVNRRCFPSLYGTAELTFRFRYRGEPVFDAGIMSSAGINFLDILLER